MASNQLHGKNFEDLIKAALFQGAADRSRSVNSEFDIEGDFDRVLGLPSSIKTTSGDTIGLADARRFWRNNSAYRMLVCSYTQEETAKLFHQVDEILLHGDMFPTLKGAISLEEITEIHNGFGIARFPRGTHDEARAWVKERLKTVQDRIGLVVLNPKIDSKSQRRLQCSVSLPALIKLAEEHPPYRSPNGRAANSNHFAHRQGFGFVPLPFRMMGSGPRTFNKTQPA